jgi:transcriptional regulator with XRE-family HTH domain
MDNLTVGQNIARLRKLKDIKAYEMAKRLNMKESTYTRYKRGETAITIDFINKVAGVFGIQPLKILTASSKTIFEIVSHSSANNSTIQNSIKQNGEMTTIIEGIIALN